LKQCFRFCKNKELFGLDGILFKKKFTRFFLRFYALNRARDYVPFFLIKKEPKKSRPELSAPAAVVLRQ